MKNLFKFCLVATMIFLPFSCDRDSIDADTGVESFNKSKKNKNTTQDIFARVEGNVVFSGDAVGSATLHRKKDRVTANIHTKGLTPGDAYTVWFIVFEAPDVFVDALYATGGVVGDNGVANLNATLSEGDVSGSIASSIGLTDAEHQGVHMLLRSHGPAIPGMEYEQTTTFNGGCGPGLNVCTDEADVIFLPI